MDVQDGGRATRVVTLPRARGDQPLPADVARLLSHLAHLIDDRIEVRGVGIGVREFAGSFLGVSGTDTVVSSAEAAGLTFHLAALALAEDLDRHPPVGLIGEDQEEPPRWERLDLGEASARIPVALAASFAAGTLTDAPVVVSVGRDWGTDGFRFSAYTRADDTAAGQAYLDDLLTRGRTGTNPYRNRILEARAHQLLGLTFRVLQPESTARADVVLPPAAWDDIDRNVHGLFAAHDRLVAAGLGTNRGVLLEGPPGTGKTAVCRALANELAGDVTVVFCDARTVAHAVRDLYREMQHLAPALVVMEDVDLVIAHRRGGGGSKALNEFLLALDGAMSKHSGVVTIATTNDVSAIDPAARRAARFDRTVPVPLPDAAGRAAILERFLRGLPDAADRVDVAAVAAATAGASGADLRELVTRAVLERADAPVGSATPDTEALVALASEVAGAGPRPGLYL